MYEKLTLYAKASNLSLAHMQTGYRVTVTQKRQSGIGYFFLIYENVLRICCTGQLTI